MKHGLAGLSMSRALALTAGMIAITGCGPKEAPPRVIPPAPPALTNSWKSTARASFGFKADFPWNDPITRPCLFDLKPDTIQDAETYSSDRYDTNKQACTHYFSVNAARFRKGSSKESRDEAAAVCFTLKNLTKDMKASEPTDVTWGGQPAREITLEAGDKSKARFQRVVVRQLATDSFAFVGSVGDQGDLTPAELKRFFDSFQLLPPTGK